MYLYWFIWAASSDRVYPRHDLPFQSKWTTQMNFGMKTENGLQHSVTQARTQGWGSVLHPGRTQEPSKPHIILSHWAFLQNLTQFLIGISSQIQCFHTSHTNETRSYALLRTFPPSLLIIFVFDKMNVELLTTSAFCRKTSSSVGTNDIFLKIKLPYQRLLFKGHNYHWRNPIECKIIHIKYFQKKEATAPNGMALGDSFVSQSPSTNFSICRSRWGKQEWQDTYAISTPWYIQHKIYSTRKLWTQPGPETTENFPSLFGLKTLYAFVNKWTVLVCSPLGRRALQAEYITEMSCREQMLKGITRQMVQDFFWSWPDCT